LIEFWHRYGDDVHKVLGLKVSPHASAQDIYYRIGVRFLSVPASGIVDKDFRALIEWLKTSACDFLIIFTYPELVEYKRLESYMQEDIKGAPANKRIFIKSLTESDLATILTDPATFSTTFEELILDTIRDFNEGMLAEHLLTPLYGLKWAHKRLNPNDEANIYSKLGEKWFKQTYEAIEDSAIREFIKKNYRGPSESPIEFRDGEMVEELFDNEMNMIVSEYEKKVYRLLENYYRVEKFTLEGELERTFVTGALYKLKQAGLSPYQFIVDRLLATKNLVKISPEFDASGQKMIVTTRKVLEEKQSASNMVKEMEKALYREVKVPFDGEVYVFSNEKYISDILDELKLVDEFVASLSDSEKLVERAVTLTQLYYITKSLEKIRTQPGDGFTEIIQRIQKCIETAETAEIKIIDELAKRSSVFIPKTCMSVKQLIKKYLVRISGYVKKGRLLDLIGREVEKLENLVSKFDEECGEVTLMLMNIDDEILENNEKSKNIIGKKDSSMKASKNMSRYKLDRYLESTLVSLEKIAFEALSIFLKNVDSLEKPREIDPKETERLLKALEKIEFKGVLKPYRENVKSVRERTLEIDNQYASFSADFITKSDGLVSSLANFWSQKIVDIEDKVYSLRITTDGISRAVGLINFYHEIVELLGFSGAKIANAIACGFLDSFLFLDRTDAYAKKLGMSAEEFSTGLYSLKKVEVLREGVG